MKFSYAQSSLAKAKYVIIGCADQSGSTAQRQGTSAGPAAIRRVSQREIARRDGHEVLMQEARHIITQRIHDQGDVKKKELEKTIKDIAQTGKIPITLGGDHSITFEVLKGLNEIHSNIALVYFDAHPDCVCSKRHYYGSVVCDASELKNVDSEHSVLVGVREPEKEEFANIKRLKLHVIDVHYLAQKGTREIAKQIKKIVGRRKVYVSIDLDVVDPAFAPGVDVPCPGGPSSLMFLDLLHQIRDLDIIGIDVTELSPPHDRDDLTAHLAVRCLVELIK